MKILRLLPYIVLFNLFLILGFWTGRVTLASQDLIPSKSVDHQNQPSDAATTSPAVPANGQHNLLVIGVDDLEAPEPQLESVWLILYVENTPQLTLLPIYPTIQEEDASAKRRSLAKSFQLTPDRTPSSKFIEVLESRDLWWNGFVLLDRTALAEIVKFFDSRTGHQSQSEAAEIVAKIPAPQKDRMGALVGQVTLAQKLCAGSGGLSPSLDTIHIIEQIPQHLVTDFDLEQSTIDWKNLIHRGSGFSCEFPTLATLLSTAH